MSAAIDELYSLLVPLAEGRLVVPRACIAEVASLTRPDNVDGTQSWLLGKMDWNGRSIPLVSFEGACGEATPRTGPRSRVVVFRAMTDTLRSGFYGLITQGFPQLVRVNPGVLSPDPGSDWPDDSPIICRVRMVNQRPLIPDLERLENMIAAELDRAS